MLDDAPIRSDADPEDRDWTPRVSNARSQPFVLGLGGTPRDGSSVERALGASLRAAEAAGARTLLLGGRDLLLPIYEPGAQAVPAAKRLVEALRTCDAVIVASPAYHGTVSGLVKNALDYAEELRSDGRCYLDGVAVGLIACAGGWQAAGQTLTTLRTIAHALRGWPTPFGAAIKTGPDMFDETGTARDETVRDQLAFVGQQVVEFARMRLHQAA
jgi:FMN reductase